MTNLSKSFVTAGRASFVVSNPAGESLTLLCKRARAKQDSHGQPLPPKFWVTWRHNNDSWHWVGTLDVAAGKVNVSPRALNTAVDQRLLKIANWALECIWKGLAVPSGYSLEHTGRCGRCGKMLRDADSIKSGFGPECVKYI